MLRHLAQELSSSSPQSSDSMSHISTQRSLTLSVVEQPSSLRSKSIQTVRVDDRTEQSVPIPVVAITPGSNHQVDRVADKGHISLPTRLPRAMTSTREWKKSRRFLLLWRANTLRAISQRDHGLYSLALSALSALLRARKVPYHKSKHALSHWSKRLRALESHLKRPIDPVKG